MRKTLIALTASTFVIWGCAQDGGGDATATADLLDAETLERPLGEVTFRAGTDGGVVAAFDVGANDVISPGAHAIHLHENADCGPADTDGDGEPEAAGAAGGHYDPTGVGHGEDDGPHVGDSAEYNYAFGDDGAFDGEVAFPLAELDAVLGETAIIVHQGVDDMETNPGGESGPRIACAVVAAAD